MIAAHMASIGVTLDRSTKDAVLATIVVTSGDPGGGKTTLLFSS
ncbi:hypothetical protein BH09MYX1_BH09MYX1_00900 [soil metagenome]